jgi:RNA polymerase subunit RPABC4/transcription elongation factor Spt4
MLTCPNCSHTFTHTAIGAAIIEEARREPFLVLPRPRMATAGEVRTCPNCKAESLYQRLDLSYSEGG